MTAESARLRLHRMGWWLAPPRCPLCGRPVLPRQLCADCAPLLKRLELGQRPSPPEGVDCILVLGCGVYADGSPTPMLYDRLARGVELYGAGWADVLLLSGDNRSADYNELATMDRVAQDLGAPAEAITLDYAGLSTYDSLYRAREIFGVESLVIVTQDYHLSRALYLAEALGLEAWGVAAEGEDRPGQLYRELREILARDKDFFWAIFQPEATILGEPEPLT